MLDGPLPATESDVDGPLSPADYDLSLYRDTNASGDPDDIGTVVIKDS